MSAFAGAADALANYDQGLHAASLRETGPRVKPVRQLSHILVHPPLINGTSRGYPRHGSPLPVPLITDETGGGQPVIAPWAAEPTSLAYLASTPVV